MGDLHGTIRKRKLLRIVGRRKARILLKYLRKGVLRRFSEVFFHAAGIDLCAAARPQKSGRDSRVSDEAADLVHVLHPVHRRNHDHADPAGLRARPSAVFPLPDDRNRRVWRQAGRQPDRRRSEIRHRSARRALRAVPVAVHRRSGTRTGQPGTRQDAQAGFPAQLFSVHVQGRSDSGQRGAADRFT